MATPIAASAMATASASMLPSREKTVGGSAAGRGASAAPAVRCGTVASSRPSAAMMAEMPLGVERMMGTGALEPVVGLREQRRRKIAEAEAAAVAAAERNAAAVSVVCSECVCM